MKTVLLCGCDGYIGHALTLRLLAKGYRVIGVDDFQRRFNVKHYMSSFSATDISTPQKRHDVFEEIGQFDFIECAIDSDIEKLEKALQHHDGEFCGQIDVIVNLAQQPSAPFSLKTQQDAVETTYNNLIGTLNILYYMKRFAPNAHLIQIGSMGEYDHAAGIDIAEGVFDFEFRGREAKNVIYPRRPGSFYHASKVASTYYIDAASRWWGIRATDIMQGVVYGNWTPEIDQYKEPTRLDSDECFGTVVNRFIVQALLDQPLTVYGSGEQKRGYLALNDSIQCLMLAIENEPKTGEYRTWNQVDTVHTINEIASIISNQAKSAWDLDVKIKKIETPRAEKTSKFEYYKVDDDKLRKLGFRPSRSIIDEVHYILSELMLVKTDLYPLNNVVLPIIKWK